MFEIYGDNDAVNAQHLKQNAMKINKQESVKNLLYLENPQHTVKKIKKNE
jgi:hypothetical protein